MQHPIRVLLVDDHPVVRKGLAACLGRAPSLAVIGEAADGREGLRLARSLRPDIVLTDMDMPNLNGLGLAAALRKELPGIKVLVLSMHSDSDGVLQVLQSGACGYILKAAPMEELIHAVEQVCAGRNYFSDEVARVALSRLVTGQAPHSGSQLTPREREVLILIAEGLSNKEIACRLDLGVRTIETHRERVMRKLNIHSIAGLTRYAVAKGLISLPGHFAAEPR